MLLDTALYQEISTRKAFCLFVFSFKRHRGDCLLLSNYVKDRYRQTVMVPIYICTHTHIKLLIMHNTQNSKWKNMVDFIDFYVEIKWHAINNRFISLCSVTIRFGHRYKHITRYSSRQTHVTECLTSAGRGDVSVGLSQVAPLYGWAWPYHRWLKCIGCLILLGALWSAGVVGSRKLSVYSSNV